MKRGEAPSDVAAALTAMKVCRDAMIDACREVRPMGTMYHGASMVIAAIDAMARLLTGRPDHFSIEGTVGPASSDSNEG